MKKYILYTGSLLSVVALGLAITFSFKPEQASASAVSTLSGRDLTIGDTGSDVADLQGLLGEQGYLTMPIGVSFGYFGSLTKNALSRYQTSIGVYPASGYFGPLTREKMTQIFTAKGWMALLVATNR